MDALLELIQHIENTRGLSNTLRRIRAFHQAKPEVLDLVVQELLDTLANGWTSASVESIWNYARWVLTRKNRVPGETYEMDQRFASYYARMIAILHPELNGFYEMREGALSRKGRGADAELGTKLEPGPAGKRPGYIRRLFWADHRDLERGWRPSTPHEPKPVSRRERVRRERHGS